MKHFGQSQRRSCEIVKIYRSSYNYKHRRRNDSKERSRIKQLSQENRRWGCETIHNRLRLEGITINHKKTELIYREEKLMLDIRKRRKTASSIRVKLPIPAKPNERRAMDFLSDALYNGMPGRIPEKQT